MHTESEIVCNPTLRRRWDSLYLLGLAPPPLPESPEMAWYHYVLNGHLRYARLDERVVRDDIQDLFRANPQYFRDLPVYIPPNCTLFIQSIFSPLKHHEYVGSVLPLSDPLRQRAQRITAAFQPEISPAQADGVTAPFNGTVGPQHSQMSRGPQYSAHDQMHNASVPQHLPQVNLGQFQHRDVLLIHFIPKAHEH